MFEKRKDNRTPNDPSILLFMKSLSSAAAETPDIPIMLYNGERGNVRHNSLNRWFFYVYYPTHMILLTILVT